MKERNWKNDGCFKYRRKKCKKLQLKVTQLIHIATQEYKYLYIIPLY